MAFDAGAIVGEVILTRDKWTQSVKAVQKDVQNLKDRTRELSKEFIQTGSELNRLGSRLAMTGALVLTPFVAVTRTATKENEILVQSFNRLDDAIRPLRIELQMFLVPWIDRLTESVKNLSNKWESLSPTTRKFIIDLMVSTGVILTALGLVTKLAGSFVYLYGWVVKAGGAITAFLVNNPWVAAVIGITALVTGNGKIVGDFLDKLLKSMRLATSEIVSLIQGSFYAMISSLIFLIEQLLPESWRTGLDNIRNTLDSWTADYLAKANQAAAEFADLWKPKTIMLDPVKVGTGGPFEQFVAGWKNSFNDLKNTMANFGQFGRQMATRTAEAMREAFSNTFFDFMTGNFSDLKTVAQDFTKTLLRMFADMLAQLVMYYLILIPLATLATAVGVPAPALAAIGLPQVKGHQEGIDNVPATGLYKLHAGEEVRRSSEIGGGGGMSLTIHNLITSQAIALAMSQREGRGVIVNVIDENSLRNGIVRREITRR